MNSIRPQTVTLAAIAIVFGLITAYGAKRLLEPKPVVEQPVVEAPHLKMIAIAQRNFAPYDRITDRDVMLLEAANKHFEELPGVMSSTQRAVGRLVKRTISAGQPIQEGEEGNVYPVGKVPDMADDLPAGYRAVNVRVDDAIASNGAILTGSLVDVSLTFDSDHPDIDGVATVCLFRKMQVLSPSSKKEAADVVFQTGTGKATITLAATPEQANKLILAQQYGTVNVTLCSSKEKGVESLAEGNRNLVNKVALLDLPPIPPPPILPTPTPPVRRVVEIYHGADVQQIVFNEAGELLSTEEAEGAGAEAVAPTQPGTAATQSKRQKPCATCKKGGKKPPIHYAPSATGPTPSPAPTPAEQPSPAVAPAVSEPTPTPARPTLAPTPARPIGPAPTPDGP